MPSGTDISKVSNLKADDININERVIVKSGV